MSPTRDNLPLTLVGIYQGIAAAHPIVRVIPETPQGLSGILQPLAPSSRMNNKQIPPVKKQTKIAQILSTWEQVMVTTEKLIANSQV